MHYPQPTMPTPTGTFSLDRFEGALTTEAIGRRVLYREVVETTMTLAREQAAAGAAHGTLVLAEEQTAGRGRRGRSFYSPPGENLYFTLVLRPSTADYRRLPLSVPLAVCRAIAAEGLEARIKWPNDIWIGERKTCGILIDGEMTAEGSLAFPGIGINVNGDPTVAAELRDTATSVRRELGRPVERERLLARVCNQLEVTAALPEAELAAAYRGLSMVLGRPVRVKPLEGAAWEGLAIDVEPGGGLVVARDGGAREVVMAGDVSVRPL